MLSFSFPLKSNPHLDSAWMSRETSARIEPTCQASCVNNTFNTPRQVIIFTCWLENLEKTDVEGMASSRKDIKVFAKSNMQMMRAEPRLGGSGKGKVEVVWMCPREKGAD